MKTVLHAIHEELAAHFVEDGGWEVPGSFHDPEGEYRAVRTDCGLADLSHRAVLVVEGPDAREFLHGLVTADVKKLPAGKSCRAALLTVKGRMLADARISALDGRLVLDLPPGLGPKLREHLEKYVVAARVEVRDATGELGLLTVQGRGAFRVLSELMDDPIEPLAPFDVLTCKLEGQPLHLIGTASTGEAGCDLLAPTAVLPELWRTLIELGGGMRPVGLQALEMLRVETGVPRFGPDMNHDTIPLEAGLDDAISYTKGCYLGQEVIARVTHQGHVNRKLTGLLLEVGCAARPGALLFEGEREVGCLCSVVQSPFLGRPIALGYVRPELLAPGTVVSVEGAGTATVHELPFYRSR